MAPVYGLLGISVRFIRQGMDTDQRRAAYAADVTYVTATEAGFDYLRDGLALTVAQQVQRQRYSALVDEADSLLIDEARVPLVLAGARAPDVMAWPELTTLVGSLTPGVHFDTDEYARNVELTDAGLDRVEQALRCGSLHDDVNHVRLTRLNCALHARTLLHRDVDYLVSDGRIELVDDDTGRVMHDRRWPDGLQAALEAKEGLLPRDQGMPLASTTLQRFLGGYARLCGMTGTAQAAADELWESYGTPVVVVPTHRPVVRDDRPDVVFSHRETKERAIVEDVRMAHRSGRPVLVGTRTVADSERLAARLTTAGISCAVLNARDDSREAEIVAAAGTVGAVTISTNMAGRGTDIRLGGADGATRAQVVALGGLYVIGTSRHESRRVDLQLRGRAGRQGDPGETRFLLSLDDDLLVRFGIEGLIPATWRPSRQDTPLEHPVVRREVARAQRIAEGQDREIRRTLARYTAVVDDQYAAFRARRQAVLHESTPDGDALLGRLDGRWSEHLALCEDLREGIHLVRLGGRDPVAHYAATVMAAFDLNEAMHVDVDVVRPTSTWTYLVNDDPFRAQVALSLLGPGGVTMAIYAGALLTPLLLLWGSVDRWGRRRGSRGVPPRGA
jgi:preprotein translocase subunit SecA